MTCSSRAWIKVGERRRCVHRGARGPRNNGKPAADLFPQAPACQHKFTRKHCPALTRLLQRPGGACVWTQHRPAHHPITSPPPRFKRTMFSTAGSGLVRGTRCVCVVSPTPSEGCACGGAITQRPSCSKTYAAHAFPSRPTQRCRCRWLQGASHFEGRVCAQQHRPTFHPELWWAHLTGTLDLRSCLLAVEA
jgi:hypothetical protein